MKRAIQEFTENDKTFEFIRNVSSEVSFEIFLINSNVLSFF